MILLVLKHLVKSSVIHGLTMIKYIILCNYVCVQTIIELIDVV
jgi:hypothetical protein